MKIYIRFNSHCSVRAMLLALFCACVIPVVSGRAQTVKNQFVGAVVTGGLINFYKGDPANKEQLSFQQTSYLTVKVENQFYSNCPYGGLIAPNSPHPIDFFLGNDQSSKIGDTIQSVWKESGFDIVQKVYPVAFSNSGVIVLSISIVNHTAAALQAQAQYLLDNENSNTIGGHDSANDDPFFVANQAEVRTWKDFTQNTMPSFFLAYEFAPNSTPAGTVGIGYTNDSFTPQPLGLVQLSFLEFGNWTVQGAYTFGPPPNSTPHRTSLSDEATLMMGLPETANAFSKGVNDSVTEIMRTAYGTPEPSNASVNTLGNSSVNNHFDIYPNPLTTSATLNFSLDTRSAVTISIFDELGREVATPVSGEERDAGDNEVTFDARSLAPGVYTCRLTANGVEQTAKVVVMK